MKSFLCSLPWASYLCYMPLNVKYQLSICRSRYIDIFGSLRTWLSPCNPHAPIFVSWASLYPRFGPHGVVNDYVGLIFAWLWHIKYHKFMFIDSDWYVLYVLYIKMFRNINSFMSLRGPHITHYLIHMMGIWGSTFQVQTYNSIY